MYQSQVYVNPKCSARAVNISRMDLHERLRQARLDAGFETASAASARFGWAESRYRHHENGTRGVRTPQGVIYARAYRVSVEWLMFGSGSRDKKQVPVVGIVGAGSEIFPMDDGGALEWIDAMPGLGPDAVAVTVRGNSMFPRYLDGDTLVYDRHVTPRQANGQECVVRLKDGRCLVKTVRHRDNIVSLDSYNAPSIENVAVDWLAPIVWVKRA